MVFKCKATYGLCIEDEIKMLVITITKFPARAEEQPNHPSYPLQQHQTILSSFINLENIKKAHHTPSDLSRTFLQLYVFICDRQSS